MKTWKSVLALAVISIGIPLFFVYQTRSIIWFIVLPLWILAVLLLGFELIRRHGERERRIMSRMLEDTAIRTLTHHRHDWMNDLQILYGYIRLGKFDKATQCVDKIKERMGQESRISRLGIPSLVFYLQSFRIYNSSLELEVHVEENLHLGGKISPENGEHLAMAVMQTIRAYQYNGQLSCGDTGKLSLSIYQEGEELVVKFEGDRMAPDSNFLREQIYNVVQGKRMKAEQLSPSQSFQLRVPCEL